MNDKQKKKATIKAIMNTSWDLWSLDELNKVWDVIAEIERKHWRI